ncbi:MAG TPA: hypothetical protein VGK51_11435 [Actinomycetota bacterium]
MSDAAAKTFAEPDSDDTDGDADGLGEGLGEADGEGDALGVADADAVGVGVGAGVAVAVAETEGVAVSVTVAVGVAGAVEEELAFTLLPLQAVATTAMQATRARQYRSLAGERMLDPSFLPFSAFPPWATAETEAR